MHTQIKIPTKSGIIQQQRNTKTFQKDKSKQELLEHSSVKTTMIYAYTLNRGLGVKSRL